MPVRQTAPDRIGAASGVSLGSTSGVQVGAGPGRAGSGVGAGDASAAATASAPPSTQATASRSEADAPLRDRDGNDRDTGDLRGSRARVRCYGMDPVGRLGRMSCTRPQRQGAMAMTRSWCLVKSARINVVGGRL